MNETIEDILINLKSQIHIIDVSENNEYFIYMVVDSTKANLGMTKALLNKYKDITKKCNIFIIKKPFKKIERLFCA